MKIAQIAPLMESVPPRLYGGSERIVSYLTDELVRAGHDVTLFASGDSVSSARLVPCVPIALRLDANVRDPIPYANFVATVYHGIPAQLLKPNYRPRGNYLAFLGRISPEKRPDRAIRIARALEIPLKIAAKVDKVDEAYFREKIVPLLNQPGVEFIGEIDERAKSEFLGDAAALLFPVDWPEPFGLSMIEAMACGTPVLAFRCGSVPEIVDHGVTGFIVGAMDEAIRMVPEVLALDRRAVRQRFDQRFSAARMAKDYVHVYRSLLKRPALPERETALPRLQPELEKGMN